MPVNNYPIPMPRSILPPQNLHTLHNCMAIEKRSKENTFNVAKALFKAGSKVTYKRNGREDVALVLGVIGVPGKIRIQAERIATKKKIELQLEDIAGIVQE